MRIQWGPADTGSCKPRSRSSPALRGDTVSRQCNCRKSRFSLLIRIVVSGPVSALLRRSEPSITRCHRILTGTSLCIPTRAASARGQGTSMAGSKRPLSMYGHHGSGKSGTAEIHPEPTLNDTCRTILGVRSLGSAPLKRSGYSRFVRRGCTDRASRERRRGGARFESRRCRDWRAAPWRPRCRRP